MPSFLPLTASERASLRAALERNGRDGTPLTMSPRDTTSTAVESEPRQGVWRRFWGRILLRGGPAVEETNPIVAEAVDAEEDVINAIQSVPVHY